MPYADCTSMVLPVMCTHAWRGYSSRSPLPADARSPDVLYPRFHIHSTIPKNSYPGIRERVGHFMWNQLQSPLPTLPEWRKEGQTLSNTLCNFPQNGLFYVSLSHKRGYCVTHLAWSQKTGKSRLRWSVKVGWAYGENRWHVVKAGSLAWLKPSQIVSYFQILIFITPGIRLRIAVQCNIM